MSSEFQAQGNPIEGIDDAAKWFFDNEKDRQARAARGGNPALPPIPPEQQAAIDELEAKARGEAPKETVVVKDDLGPDEEYVWVDEQGNVVDAPEGEAAAAAAAEEEETFEGSEDDPLFEVQVQGETLTRPFSEILQGYQRQEDYTRKVQEVAREREALEAERGNAIAEITRMHQAALGIGQALKKELEKYQGTTDMDKLRLEDPAEWAARLEEQRNQERLIQAAEQEDQARVAAERRAAIPRERAALQKVSESFANDFDGTYERVSSWVTSPEGGGLSPEEWQPIIDHRLVRIAELAMSAQATNQATRLRRRRVQKKVASLRHVHPAARVDSRDKAREDIGRADQRLRDDPTSLSALTGAFLAREQARGR